MRNILNHLDKLLIKNSLKSILLLLDYDGTLTHIAKKPNLAKLSRSQHEKLTIASSISGVQIGIITGRSLKDILNFIDPSNLIVAANHGFEVLYKKKIYYPSGKCFLKPFHSLAIELKKHLETIPEIVIEAKGFSVAVHYRLTPRKYWKELEKSIRQISSPWRKRYTWKITGGKMVWEIRPSSTWNKGHVVKWIWNKFTPDALPFYIGDDVTDEDAFRAFSKKGITIVVGKRANSNACYFVKDVSDVWKIINLISEKKGGTLC